VEHISVIACVSAAGESLLPYIVTPQNSSTVQEHLKKQGIRFGRDFTLKFDQKPYVNAGIFLDDIRTVFLPYVDTLRAMAAFAQEVAVSLMDNYSAHVSDDVIRILTEAMVRIITFAPHTTQVFQVLDLTLFGIVEWRPRHELPFQNDHATLKVIRKVYRDFTQTMVPSNVWGAFRTHELEFYTRRESDRLYSTRES
jgi:hypothetical protein